MMGSGFSSIDISATGLTAERHRMEVIANNIANANSTRTPQGGPYRRQQVVFSANENPFASVFRSIAPGMETMGGVSVNGITHDQSELPKVFNPGHPDADAEGMVSMPNVQVPFEMVDMITASRSYEANLRSIKSFRQMAEQTLTLLRGNG